MGPEDLRLRKINSSSTELVQRILDSAPSYYLKVEGVTKVDDAAKKVFEELPPNCTFEDKFVFFVELDGRPIGIAELIVGYPDRKTAFLGLFVLDEKFQGQGHGRASYLLIEDFVRTLSMNSIQLGVNDTNDVGMAFWPKLGFVMNGRSRPNKGVKLNSTVYVMERFLK